MIKVTNTLKCYDLGETNSRKEEEIIIKSHWPNSNWIIIELGNGDKITVVANDLITAVKNATNINRF